MKAVFYFDFYDSEEDFSTVYGFNMELASDSILIEDFDESYDFFWSDTESDYGVHDWSSSPNDNVIGIGYTSYEVDPGKYDELMEKWREYFVSRPDVTNVTGIVQLPNSNDERLDDLGIYELVKANS